ncbi:uncharacterized protein EI97DRAFT_136863 [Westerdykella ornata]|uniref:DNA2/NAM7 helicase-like C-terminal domain-containing protein n=1 Tax=Westerdykella ornata TaxID=318751 RepID=A0A6A6JCZ6_WESOR|nr:uncharacterized protein EI97DRAFT_136863 [Westerdykella ornata]KAF2274137.1 hypothetical protein EI97DRAFT_136863 [Westerdykella ornata]
MSVPDGRDDLASAALPAADPTEEESVVNPMAAIAARLRRRNADKMVEDSVELVENPTASNRATAATMALAGPDMPERSEVDTLVSDEEAQSQVYQPIQLYRLHPDIMEWVSSEFYHGTLQHAPLTLQIHPVQRTVSEFFRQRLGAAKNDRCRMAIDVSGDGVSSEKYLETTSFCNAREAEMVANLTKALLDYDPPYGGKKVRPWHIGIMTPYKGQKDLIREMLLERGLDVKVATTFGMQSNELCIGLVSLVVNSRDSAVKGLSFIADPYALRVQNSRSRWFQSTVGNFAGWCWAMDLSYTYGTKGKFAHHRLAAFRSLVASHYVKGDIVSSVDIEQAIFGDNPRVPTSSAFYTKMANLILVASVTITTVPGNDPVDPGDQRVQKRKRGNEDSTRLEKRNRHIAQLFARHNLRSEQELEQVSNDGKLVDDKGAPYSNRAIKDMRRLLRAQDATKGNCN